MAYNIFRKQILSAGDMSQASITSAVLDLTEQDNAGIQLVWTGTPTGTFSVQVSLDHVQDAMGNVQVPGTWSNLTLSSPPAPAGAAGNGYIDLNQIAAPYVRVVYTLTSGTGSLNITAFAKGV